MAHRASEIKRSQHRLLEIALTLTIFSVSFGVFLDASQHGAQHSDEVQYIATGRYFNYLFLNHDVDATVLQHEIESAVWDDNYWTHTQPVLTRLIVGSWLWISGYDPDALPGPYDREISQTLLHDARRPFVLLAAGTVTLMYALGRFLAGRLAGVAASALTIVNPLAQEHLVRVIPEAPLMFFILLGTLLAVIGAQQRQTGYVAFTWAIGSGCALGLALQSKLTALYSIAAVVIWGTIVVMTAWWPYRRDWRFGIAKAWTAGRGWAGIVIIALAVFVASNPHLYPDPLLHTEHLLRQRAKEMDGQTDEFSQWAAGDLLVRTSYVVGGSLVIGNGLEYGDTDIWSGVPVGALMAPIGALTLLHRSRRYWQHQQALMMDGLVLVTTFVYFVGITMSIHMYWPRYLVPTLMLGSVLGGIGVATTVGWMHAARDRVVATYRRTSQP